MSEDTYEHRSAAIGPDHHLDAETVLEAAKGRGFRSVIVIGELDGRPIWVSASDGLGETLILLELVKLQLLGK